VAAVYTTHNKQEGPTSTSSAGFEATICQQPNGRIPMPAAAKLEPEPTSNTSLHLSIRRVIKQIRLIIGAYQFCKLHTKFYPTSCCQSLTPYAEEITGYNQCGFRRNLSASVHIFCIHYMYIYILWPCDPTRVMASSFLRLLDHTKRRTTVGRTPLDE